MASAPPSAEIATQIDPFEGLDSLEETSYQEGHSLGLADGARQGRTEGRIFGLEKGFEKFLEMGKLRGRAEVLDARFAVRENEREVGNGSGGGEVRVEKGLGLEGERLRRHVERLAALTDSAGFSTENEEEGVEGFEQRVRDARGKCRVVERILGEGEEKVGGAGVAGVEVLAGTRREGARVVQRREDGAGEGRGRASEMEDFGTGKGRK